MIEVRDLVKVFDTRGQVVRAVDNVSTNVAKGEVLFTVDARAARASLDQAAAAINEARASIAEASAAQKTAREQLALYRSLSDPAAVSRACSASTSVTDTARWP